MNSKCLLTRVAKTLARGMCWARKMISLVQNGCIRKRPDRCEWIFSNYLQPYAAAPLKLELEGHFEGRGLQSELNKNFAARAPPRKAHAACVMEILSPTFANAWVRTSWLWKYLI